MLKLGLKKLIPFSVSVAVAVGVSSAFAGDSPARIRLQLVFDKGAMDYISNAGADYDEFAASCVTRMNTVLANSRLTDYFTYELAGTTLLPGVDNINPATGYTEGWEALCGNRGDDWAGMLQDRYNNAADVVVLLINTGSYAGLTGNSHPYTGSGAEYAINYAGSAFSVCSIMTAAREIQGVANGHQVLSHEVAHTLGCGHSDTQDRQQGPQSATYSAALQFRLPDGKETMLPRSYSVTRDIMAYFGTTLMGYPEHFFYKEDGQGGRVFMTRDEVKALMGWTDDQENDIYFDNTDGIYEGYPQGVFCYSYIVPYFSSPNLYFSNVTVPYGMELTDGVVTVYDQAQYDAMSAEDKAKVVPMGDATHNNRQVLIDNCQYASRWHLGVKFSKEGSDSVVNGKSDKITLTPLSKNLTIYYTTDGTEPTKSNGTLYTEPFSLTTAATVKARSYDANDNAGDVLSKSYTMLPLATALGNTELTWTVDSHAWFATGDGAQSGNVWADNGTSTLSTTVLGEGTLSFEYELFVGFNDTLTVKVDGVEVKTISDGTTNWQSAEVNIVGDTEHTIEFTVTSPYWFGDSTYAKLRNVTASLTHSAGTVDPEEPVVESPVAAAVWHGNFSSSVDGYTLTDCQQTHGENMSSVTIDHADQGLLVDFAAAKGYVTVLVKYTNLAASSSNKRVLFATTANSDYSRDRCGIRLLTGGTVQGLWNASTTANNDADYDPVSTGTVPSAGVLAFVYDKGDGGTSVYVAGSGEPLPTTALWNNTALKAGDIHGFAVGGMCRNASADGVEAAQGMTITGLAIFTNVLSAAEMNAYEWPYAGPAPTAVWVAGEFGDDRSAHGGFEFALNGNTTNALGQIVIGNSATLGATIALPDATYQKMTMLVKYSVPSGGAPAANAVPAAMFSTYDLGARAAQAASSALDGYWYNGSSVQAGTYAFSTPAQTMPQEGYILISNWATNANPNDHGTAVYTGESLSTLSGGEKSGLRFTGADHYITSVGIGGPTVAGAKPWAGMVIKNVAIFLDEYLNAEDLANYKFPEQGAVQPEDSDLYAIEPVASWVNDFKTATKGDCTLSVSGTTAAKDDSFGGTLTIGDASAVIDVSGTANGGNVTVLVKYRATSATVNAPVVTFGETLSNSIKIDVGAYTQSARTLAVNRSWSGGNNKWVALNTAASLNEGEGYLLCARKYNDMLVYVGDSLDSMTGGSTAAPGDIEFTCNLIQAIGIGGPSGLPNADSTWSAFDGFVVEKVVVFNGYYTPDQIRYIPNPEEGDTLSIADGATWNFAAGTTRTYTNIGTLSAGGTIAVTNASELSEGYYTLATWTTAQKYTTRCAGYGKVGTLVTDGLAEGLSARLVYGAKAIYLRVDDVATQAARKPIVILPYGDSITEGFTAEHTGANYRILLYQKLELLGFKVKSVGIYDKDDGYDSVDPCGDALSNDYKWHSAKHGAVVGRSTATASGRSDLEENVDTVCAQAGKPDAVLLHIGINDLVSSDRVSLAKMSEPVFASWTNVVWRLVNDLPDAKIIVSTVLYGAKNQKTRKIGSEEILLPDLIDDFNDRIKAYMDTFPAGRVYLADLNDYVKSDDYGIIYKDNIHPDWWGHDQMAEGWLSVITNQFAASQDFSSSTPIVAPLDEKLGAAAKDELADYISGFRRYAVVEPCKNILPTLESAIPYSQVNSKAATNDIEKVGYFVEYVRSDNNVHKWVWVDMDAFGSTIEDVGLPKAKHQHVVTGLHVKSNHGAIDDVPADDDSVTGFVEFSPFDYSPASSGVEGAPKDYAGRCDWNDTLSESGSKSCMQVHRIVSSTSAPGGQVLFAYNNWRSGSSEAEFGIGNFSQHFHGGSQTFDYSETTGLATMNASAYSVKRIEIWTKEKATNTDYPTPYSWIDTYFPELVDGWTSAQYNDFATNKTHSSVRNGYAPWESYVLGLDPTDETSKFTAIIRMEGETPVVEYSPTNEVLKASGDIEYVLQGKPELVDTWQDVPFADPGDTNRFFRVKVTW